MADVFLSYCRADRETAAAIVNALRKAGISVFWDEDLPPGAHFRTAIQSEIEGAHFVLVLFSADSVKSDFVLDEAEIARSEDKLIPLRDANLEAGRVPPGFGQRNSYSVAQLGSVIEFIKLRKSEIEEAAARISRDVAERRAKVDQAAAYQLDEVFSGGHPSVTEIDRAQDKSLRLLKADLLSRGKIVNLFGQSKSGKTTFVKQVFRDRGSLRLHGSSIKKVAEFERQIAERVAGFERRQDLQSLAEACRALRLTIIIDDFHNVDRGTAKAIVKRAKVFLDEGVTLVCISIPDLSSLFEEAHDEIHGRDAVHKITVWSDEQIRMIGARGFAALNVECSDDMLATVARWSHRSPLMMQEHCRNICALGDVWSTQSAPAPIDVSVDDLEAVFRDSGQRVAATFGKQLRKRGDKFVTLSNGKDVTVYEALMLAICRLGISQPISVQTLGRRLRKLLADGADDTKNAAVKQHLTELTQRTEKLKSASETIGFYEDYLHILHPYFKQYLVWNLQAEYLGELPPIRI